MTFDHDKRNQANPAQVARAAFTIIDAMQEIPDEVKLLGAAAAFLSLSEFLGEPAQDTFAVTKNIINGTDGKHPQFVAIDDYLNGELKP